MKNVQLLGSYVGFELVSVAFGQKCAKITMSVLEVKLIWDFTSTTQSTNRKLRIDCKLDKLANLEPTTGLWGLSVVIYFQLT